MDFNTDNKADNSNASFDQSEIDKLLASLSGAVQPSEFEAMSTNDDSSDLFDEIGFDEDEEKLDDIVVEDNSVNEADFTEEINLSQGSLFDDLSVEAVQPDTVMDDNLVDYNLIDDISAEPVVENDIIDSDIFDNSMETEASSFEQMPSFSNTDILSPEPAESGLDMFVEENFQSDDIATENDDFDEAPAYEPVDPNQCNVITKGTIINGGMISDCSLSVMGKINGDIECNGKLSIFGSVVGNSKAADVYVNTKKLLGNIESAGSVKIALGTILVGNIKSKSAVIAGAVKGNLDVCGPVILDSTAIIQGNITAKSILMNNGAVFEGTCSFAYADINIDQIFES